MLIGLSGCSFFKDNSRFRNHSCQVDFSKKIQNEIDSVAQQYLKCLKENNKTSDLSWFQNVMNGTATQINIRCDVRTNDFIVLAEKKGSRYYPGFNFQNKLSLADSNIQSVRNEIFHELSHWSDQGHFKGYDLASVADACCLDSSPSSLRKSHACKMMKYSDTDWLTSSYQRDYATLMSFDGQYSNTYKNYIGAVSALKAVKNNPKIYEILNEILKITEKPYLKSKISRSEKRKKIADINLYQLFIFNLFLGLSQDEKHINASSARFNKLKHDYLSNQIDKDKILIFSDVASIYSTLINSDSDSLRRTWGRLRDRAFTVCRNLNEAQTSAIESILMQISPHLFEHKNNIPAGEFYEMATYISKPCRYKHSVGYELENNSSK